MACLPLTQALIDKPLSPPASDKNETVGYLIANDHWHEVVVGETKIGRDASSCSIVLDDETLSKVHAVVESEGAEDTFLYDAGSTNKTRIGKMTLKPHCRYKISDNDVITMGNLTLKFKIFNHDDNTNASVLPQLLKKLDEQDKRLTFVCKEIPNAGYITDKWSNSNNEKPKRNGLDEIFKTPPLSVLSPSVKLPKKDYYVPASEASSIIDIFSQTTQCEFLGNEEGKRHFISKTSDLNFTDDDIYDLPTQCEFAGDKTILPNLRTEVECRGQTLAPELSEGKNCCDDDCGPSSVSAFDRGNEKKGFEAPYLEDDIPTQIFRKEYAQPSKVREINGFNDSGKVGLGKKEKVKHYISSHLCEPLNDIFDLSTQPNVPDSDYCNLECKVPKEVSKSFKSGRAGCEVINSSKITSQIKSHESKEKKKLVNENTDNDMENRNAMTMLLNDGQDEELCELMRASSPSISIICDGPLTLPSEKMKTESVVQNKKSDEMFDMATQISLNASIPEVSAGRTPILKSENETRRFSHATSQNGAQTSKLKGDGREEGMVGSSTRRESKNQKRSGAARDAICEEDATPTQEFCVGRNGSNVSNRGVERSSPDVVNAEGINSMKEAKLCDKLFEEADDLEDLIATQIFGGDIQMWGQSREGQVPEDDIPTQIFSRQAAHAHSKGLSSPPRKATEIPAPGVVELCDSGDETESDLELKICYESSVKKDVGKGSPPCNPKQEAALTKPDLRFTSPRRPSSASSDKTVSDLDVTEAPCENGEDFIATQIFSPRHKLTSKGPQKSTSGGGPEPNCEDSIPTQIFPFARCASGSRDKTRRSGIGATASANQKQGDYDITVTSSEDEFFDVEDNTNESESLIRDIIEEFSPPRDNDLAGREKRRGLTVKVNAAPDTGKAEADPSPTLLPSHPVFDAFLEIDDLIKNRRKAQKVDGKVDSSVTERGKEEEVGLKESRRPAVVSDSDATDCEEELEAVRDAQFGKTEPAIPGKSEDEEEVARREPSPVLTSISASRQPSTSSRAVGGGASRGKGRSTRSKRDGTNAKSSKKGSKKASTTITQFFPAADGVVGESTSPMKRARATSSGEAVPKKKSKGSESKKSASSELENGEVVLTQSRKLRSRVIRENKKDADEVATSKRRSTRTEVKTPAEEYRAKALPEVDRERIVNGCSRVTRLSSARKRDKSSSSSSSVQEATVKKGQRQRRSRANDVTKADGKVGSPRPPVTKVVFTGFESEAHDRIIAELGGERVNDVGEGRVLVTDRVRRTVKFLSAVALGMPIVSPKWLVSSAREREFLDPWDFLLEDKGSEERWSFNLRATLDKWRKKKLLSGYSVYATESTRPPVPQLLSIVRCCGGVPITSQPGSWPEKSIVLTCDEDIRLWPTTKDRHVKIVHYEFLLSGVLRYSLDFKTYKLW